MRSRLSSLFRQTAKPYWVPIGLTTGFVTTYLVAKYRPTIHAESKHQHNEKVNVGEFKAALPTYSMAEVAKHTTKENGYWMTFRGGVYDLTNFVENHPGGKQILKTAGQALDGCWKVFNIHQIDHVYRILEDYRIGNLSPEERQANEKAHEKVTDLFQYDPERVNAKENFFIRSEKPFNAETKPSILVSSFLTPNEQFYIRNHMHVPVVNINEYKLELKSGSSSFSLTYDELIDKFATHTVTSVVQCAGNRRYAMNSEEQGAVQGTAWYVGAIGNAKWKGVRLRDVLQSYGLDKKGKHVQFLGLDCDTSDRCYGASIPMEKALNEDVLIAYEMNDEILPNDHGYPLRILVPGTVGARSVKWVNRIIVSDDESDSHWQRADYKVLPPSAKQPQQADYDCQPALQDFNVQSAICSPSSLEDGNQVKILSIQPTDEEIRNKSLTVKGYAVSGGGRQIHNVQISIDEGKTWMETNLEQLEQPYMRAWAWTLWKYNIPFDKLPNKPFSIICRAMDTHSNTQPDTVRGIWNIRGLMNNAWHRVNVRFDQDYLRKIST